MPRANAFGDVVWNEPEFANLFTRSNGDLVNDLTRRGNAISNQTKQTLTSEGHVDTGRLRASYTFVVDQDGEGLYVDVGSNVSYAPYVEARFPHLVPSINAGAF